MNLSKIVFGIAFLFLCVTLTAEAQGEEEAFYLGEVVVTATKSEYLLKDVPVETLVITREEIEKSNATNIMELLKWLPGIKSVGRYRPMGRDEYSINGLPSDYALILIDGQRVRGRHILTELPINMIERIEIVKGPNSVLYGSDAISGVINIITKPAPETATLKSTVAFTSYSSDIGKVSLGYRTGKLKYILGGNVNKIKGETEESEYENSNVMGKFEYDLTEKTKLKFGLGFYHEKPKYSETDKTNYSLGLDWDVNEHSSLKAGGYIWKYNDESYPGGGPDVIEEDSQVAQGELQYSHLFFLGEKDFLVTVGLESLYEEMDRTGFPARKSQTANSLFAQSEMNILESLTFVPALRWDSHSEWGEKVNPKISLLWKINESTRLRTSWGQAFKAPTFKDMYRLTYHPVGPTGFWIKGNPDLKPETSVGYRVGLERQFAKNFLATLAFFRNDVEDMIQGYWVKMFEFPPPFPVIGEYSYRNIGKVFTQGLEVELKRYFTDKILSTLSYTYTDTEDKETHKELDDVPKHRANLGIGYYDKENGLMVKLRGEYEGEAYYTDTGTGIREKIEGYFITHIRLSKAVTEHAKLFVHAENVFDDRSEQVGGGRLITGGATLSFP